MQSLSGRTGQGQHQAGAWWCFPMSAWRDLTLQLWTLNPARYSSLGRGCCLHPPSGGFSGENLWREMPSSPCDLLSTPEPPQCQPGPTPGNLTKQESWGTSAASWASYLSGALYQDTSFSLRRFSVPELGCGLCPELPYPPHTPQSDRKFIKARLRRQEQEKRADQPLSIPITLQPGPS